MVMATCFHTDGRSYFTGTENHLVQHWDIALGKPLGPPLQLGHPIRGLSAAGDATLLIREEQSPTATLYHPPTAVRGDRAWLKLAVEVLTGLEMDSGRAIQVLSAADWKARRQELERQGGGPFTPLSR
jgi:hypothetical protein